MSGKWTKGPWRYSEGVDGKKRVYGEEGREIVRAMSTIGPRRPSPEERAANSQLIAAAPELVEALLLLLDIADYKHKDCTDQSCSCRGAIKKAESAIEKAGAL